MAKRRKRYGSPPATHRRNAADEARVVRDNIAVGRKLLAEGNCQSAYEFLIAATDATGSLKAEKVAGNFNVSGDRHRKVSGPASRAAYKFSKAFKAACVKRRSDR